MKRKNGDSRRWLERLIEWMRERFGSVRILKRKRRFGEIRDIDLFLAMRKNRKN